MQFDLSPQQQAWLSDVRAFLREAFTPELEQEIWALPPDERGPQAHAFRRRLAARGWLGLTWPREFGGQGRSTLDHFLLMDEFDYWGAPAIDLTATAVGPTIIRQGTPAQQALWLPRIQAGEAEFAIGYSEPDAGSDLASLQTAAVLDGDTWVINGHKTWNTGAHYCTHEWLACRTDPTASKHKGISVLIVPLDAPGINIAPLYTWGGIRTNQIWFDNVRVPRENLVGEANQGWRYITMALEFERIAIGVTGAMRRTLEELVAFCNATAIDGQVLAQRPWVRQRLAELAVDLEAARVLYLRGAWMLDQGLVPDAESSMTKVFGSELRARLADVGTRILDLSGQLDSQERQVPLRGGLQRLYQSAPYMRFGGGANEIQRNIIAQRGLGLPR